jgi:hypothetical protein
MNKLNYNPDDFIIQRLPEPTDKKSVIEYDARNRLILVRTKDLNGNIIYNSVAISKQIHETFLNNLPDDWSNDNDKIILFALYEDGEYFLEKEKLKYDFKTKETKWVKYRSQYLTLEQVREFHEILKTIITIDEQVSEYEAMKELLEITKSDYYLATMSSGRNTLLEQLLRESDWRVLPDTPELFPNEKDLWLKWRAKIREIDKSPSDFETPLDYVIWLEETKYPIRPDIYHNRYSPDYSVEYLETEDQYVSSPDLLTSKSPIVLMEDCSKYENIIKAYEQQGLQLNTAMRTLAEKYKLTTEIVNRIKVSDQLGEES